MKIAIVSKLWEETTPLSRGGTGTSIGVLVNGLVDRGHKVTLFATGNSKTKAQKLVSVRFRPYRGDYSEMHEYGNIAGAFKSADKYDIIHCAVEQKSLFFSGIVKTPVLHSIRYGEFFEQEIALLRKYRHENFMANSLAVKKYLPFLNWRGVVHNGVETDKFDFSAEPGKYLLFLGRLSPQKGVDLAIKVAKESGKKLLISGKTAAADQEYLHKYFWPFVDGKSVVYLGEVWGRQKIRLFKEAEALLLPANIFEACANTILEALSCGTPVIATDKGSNRELIKDGETGYLADNFKELKAAVKRLGALKRENCRKRAVANFSADRMVDKYLELYKKIIAGK